MLSPVPLDSPDLSQDARLALTLAVLAQARTEVLVKELDRPDLATGGRWELAWGPAVRSGCHMYVVRSRDQPARQVLAVAGVSPSGLPIHFGDADFLELDPLPWHEAAGTMVCRGWSDAALALLTGVDPVSGRTLAEYLRGSDCDGTVIVTGHGSGAALASILALWVHETFFEMRVEPYGFGSPTPGSVAFAERFDEAFGTAGGQFVNPLDIVPLTYATLGLMRLPSIYERELLHAPLRVRLALDLVAARLFNAGISYAPVGMSYLLASTFIDADCSEPDLDALWVAQAQVQHDPRTYLTLLGAPLTGEVSAHSWPPEHLTVPRASLGGAWAQSGGRVVGHG